MPAPRPERRSPIRDELKQGLRLRRFLLASAFSLLYLVVLLIFHAQGKLDRDTLLAATAIVAGLILAFFCLFQLRWNLRFRDPSLTAAQVLAAVFTMLFVVYRAPETRLVFVAFFFVALMFGMLRASWKQLTVLGSVSLAAFALVALARYAHSGSVELLRMDMLQLVVTAVAFPWLVFIGSRVKRLHEADRRKDDFLATLAHELRNPLAPIRAGVEILRIKGEAAQGDVLPMMERQLQHLTRLLDDLLDVSRITRGKVTLHLERTELAPTVQAAVEANRALVERMRHELTVSLPAEPVWLDADPVRLAQVFSNLVNNAAKYTPAGGRIALTATTHDREVDVTILDNGTGIPARDLESIFDLFTQLEGHASHAQGGLGVGLALVRGLVALHGGTIEVRSDGPGRGSEFRVRLPRLPSAPQALPRVEPPAPPRAEPRPAEPRSAPSGARLRILVVDDNRDAASSLSLLVEAIGHEVRVAYDGEAAMRLAEEFRPQTILLDLNMPGLDGYEVCRRIRREPWGADVRCIAVSGWGQADDRRESAAAGFDAHLVKPVSPETFVQLLGDAGA